MKKLNGNYYRKFKGHSGRVYLVQVPPEEVLAADVFRLTVILTPLLFIAICAWAAGIL